MSAAAVESSAGSTRSSAPSSRLASRTASASNSRSHSPAHQMPVAPSDTKHNSTSDAQKQKQGDKPKDEKDGKKEKAKEKKKGSSGAPPPAGLMSRSRSTPDAPVPSSPQNPHPVSLSSFSPAAPIPLSKSWSFWLDDTNLWGVRSIEECLERMGYLGSVDSVQAFWCFFNTMGDKLLTEAKLGVNGVAGSMNSSAPTPSPSGGGSGSGGNGRYNWRIFDALLTPVWEDESHAGGGKYVLRCGHGALSATKFIWTKLVLSMVGAAMLHQDLICGAVLACRPHKKEIQVWIKHPPPKLTKPKNADAQKEKDKKSKDKKEESEESDKQKAEDEKKSDSASTDAPTASPAASPSASASSSAAPSNSSSSSSSSSASPSSQCTCHIDPVICVANDLRFLLGVPLAAPAGGAQPGQPSPIKIEYIPHEVTMADVAARNKRLKAKVYGRRDGGSTPSGEGSRKNSAAATPVNFNLSASPPTTKAEKMAEKNLLEAARREREAKRAAEMARAPKGGIPAPINAKASSSSGAAPPTPSVLSSPPAPMASPPPPMASPGGYTPISTPAPLGSPLSPPLPSPLASPPAGSVAGSQPRKHTWADVDDRDGDDEFYTSAGSSLANSAAGTPINSGVMPGRSLDRPSGSPPLPPTSRRGKGSVSGAVPMSRHASDPVSLPTSLSSDPAALVAQLESLVRSDPRTFEGSVGDAGLSGVRGAVYGVAQPSPAALELARKSKQKGVAQTPLRLAGERGYHPEPDSPGFNNTPVPSPSATPLGFHTPVDGGSTPTHAPRSPFTAHSPRGGTRGERAASGATGRVLAARGVRGLSHGSGLSGAFSPEMSPTGGQWVSSPTFPDSLPADELDDYSEGMLQFDPLAPVLSGAASGGQFELDRTRDLARGLLRVPLDLDRDSLALPPAGRTVQRLGDPAGALREKDALAEPPRRNSSILSLVGDKGASGVLAPHAVPARASGPAHLSQLLSAAQGGGEPLSIGDHSSAFLPAEGRSRKGSAATMAAGQDVPASADSASNNGTTEEEHQPSAFSRKARASSSASQMQHAKKHRAKPKHSPVAEEVTSRRKPRSTRTLIIYGVVGVLAALLIYLLFFTTLAPEDGPFLPEKTIADRGSRVKLPKGIPKH